MARKQLLEQSIGSDQRGKPTQSAFVESFNDKFRDYCLILNCFVNLEDARSANDGGRQHYDHVRTHCSLGEKQQPCLPARRPGVLNLPHAGMLKSGDTIT